MNALEAEIAKLVLKRFADIGEISEFTLTGAAMTATCQLHGQPTPVSFQVTGLRWSSDGTTFMLTYHTATCTLPWLHAVIQHLGQRTQMTIRLREDLRLLPLKLTLPRAA